MGFHDGPPPNNLHPGRGKVYPCPADILNLSLIGLLESDEITVRQTSTRSARRCLFIAYCAVLAKHVCAAWAEGNSYCHSTKYRSIGRRRMQHACIVDSCVNKVRARVAIYSVERVYRSMHRSQIMIARWVTGVAKLLPIRSSNGGIY